MKKMIRRIWNKLFGRKKRKEAQKEALARIGFMIVDSMSNREFRRLIQRNKRLYNAIIAVMDEANQKQTNGK